MIHWGLDDIRIVGDIVVGSLLASILRLIIDEGLFKPAARWAFRAGYEGADRMAGGKLPDLPAALGGTPEP